MKELLQRLQSPTPDFFKGIILKAIAVGAVGATLVTLPSLVPFVAFPPILTTIGGYMIAIGAVAGSVAKTAKKDGIEDK